VSAGPASSTPSSTPSSAPSAPIPADVVPAPAAEALGLLGLLAPAGVLAGRAAAGLDVLGLTSRTAWPATILAGSALVAAGLRMRSGRERSAAVWVLAALVLVTCAGVLLRMDTHRMGLIPALVDRGGSVILTGRVAAEPRAIALGWQTIITVDSVEGMATSERVATVLDDALALGDRVELVASARPLPDGGFGRWLAQAHAVALLDVREVRRVGDPGALSAASEWTRQRIRTAATRHQPQGRGGLLVGFVTGDTRLLPDVDAGAMQATGLSHLTAVSGSNTAILLAGVAGLLTLMRASARLRWALLALTVPWFAFLTRLEPSVLRAGTMALLVIAAAVHGVARDARHLLAGAVLLLVLVDPMLSWSLGLMLSAGATLGVLVIAPAIASRLERMLPRAVAGLLGITLGAQLAVAPVLLLSFGTIEWVSIPANMLAVPVAAIGATLAFIGSAVALVHVGAASSIFVLAGPAAAWVLIVARVGARFTGGPTLPESWLLRTVVVALVGVALVARSRFSPRADRRSARPTSEDPTLLRR
jgi:competence protein ComEC